MEIVPSERFPNRDLNGLLAFLGYVREVAATKGCPQLASISLAVKHIDPLAVLESIYEPGELHLYLEQPQADEAVAGAEAVFSETFAGAERFARARDWLAGLWDNTIAIGDLDRPHSGPRAFAAFTFGADASEEDAAFAPATVFIPRWQVGRRHGVSTAVANVPVTADAPIELLAQKVLAAHAKFSVFDYSALPTEEAAPPAVFKKHDIGGADWFPAAVGQALADIRAGLYRKIVLARAVDLEAGRAFNPLETLNAFRESYPSCFAFSFSDGRARSFIGATPERLAQAVGGRLVTGALAGSAPRGLSAREDARLGAELLACDKDQREHRHVAEAIARRLRALGLGPECAAQPRLFKLPNVQHLLTPIEAALPESVSLLDAVGELHPTPAVGGVPREDAVPHIGRIENFTRGLYAGTLGWLDWRGEGDFVVAIRSALVEGNRARLYAGVGIVEGSDPAREQAETDLKLRAMLDTLR
ncbi:isochorismate synthase [Ruficoccus amylovorans]|uniref:isochorismate synthase n=1 Tax=Ruficoccus amylovorans TaxID=1804625 RepID=A0A842HG37_9BACT|nr:isochorismate synthase [Ruficoccus amylovorans]MBC2594596.1 isochorismate synthase [Ruficoccus amylovorans]